MKEFLKDVAPVLGVILTFLVILIATRKRKPWSELTAMQKNTRIALVAAGALLFGVFVAGVVVAVLY